MNTASFSIDEQWDGGFTGYITIKNGSDKPLNGWTFDFLGPFKIREIWDATIVRKQGNRFTVRNREWNRRLAKGKSVSFGFVGELSKGKITNPSKQPRNFRLDGVRIRPLGIAPSKPRPSPRPPSPDSPPPVNPNPNSNLGTGQFN